MLPNCQAESTGDSIWSGVGVDYVIEIWRSGSNWYRKYRSGWLEQGGIIPQATATGDEIINFYAPFSSKPVVIMQRESNSTIDALDHFVRIDTVTNTTFTLRRYYRSGTYYIDHWKAVGQGV